MKRLFVLITCFSILQIVNASPSFIPAAIPLGQTKSDTIVVPAISQPAPLSFQSGIFKRRLDSIKKDVPLDYNDYVQNYIDIYSRNRDEMGHVLGLAKYYFPIYEKAFRDAGIPDEIKYLSIVESKLDPFAVSRVGATGLWQFMFTTGKLYGLNINDYVDDRRDPIQASYAAAAYLKDAYEEFGDWLLAIASYNCGKSNVEHAIEKAGASDFWSIRPYLPTETRGYVPAFIAVAYVMNYYNKCDITPQVCDFAVKTDTVLVNKYVALSTISQVLDINIKKLAILNPAYKKQVINGTATAPRRLVIPEIDKNKYGALYEALNNSNVAAYSPHPEHAVYNENKVGRMPSYHKVRRGETLAGIADVYGIEVHDLKAWNHLHSNKAVVGKKLRLSEIADEPVERTSVKLHNNYFTYKVKSGDTLSSIASRFEGASVEKIKSINGLKRNHLQPGTTIRINRS